MAGENLQEVWNSTPASAVPTDLQTLWDSTPGGAATGNPMASRKYANTRSSDGSQQLGAIGGATALGGVAGYFGPQILQGAATLAQSVPMLRPISGALNFASQAAKQIGPAARSVSGAVSGLASETSGQVAEQLGAGPVTAEAARVVGGALTPDIAPLALNTAKFMLSGKMATSGINFAKDLIANITNSKGNLSAAEKQYVESLAAKLMGEQDPDKAMLLIGTELEKAAAATRLAGQARSESLHAAADQAILTAKQAAEAAAQQTSDLERLKAQASTGAEQQALQQKIDDLKYQTFQDQQNYQKSQLEYLSNILRGNAAALGSTQVQYTPQPSAVSQIGGLGLAGLGLAKALG